MLLNLIATAVAAATLATVQPADTDPEPDVAVSADPGCVGTENCVTAMPDWARDLVVAAMLEPEMCGLLHDSSTLLALVADDVDTDDILIGWIIYLLEEDGQRFTDAQRRVIAAAITTCTP